MTSHRFVTTCTSLSISIALVLLIIQQQSSIYTLAKCVSEANICSGWGNHFRPLPGCKNYVECDLNLGAVVSISTCMDGTLFDNFVQYCNWDYESWCDVNECEPTEGPTQVPTTMSPTLFPTEAPTISPSHWPSWSPSVRPTYNFFTAMETNTMKGAIQDTVFVAYNPNGIAFPTTRYTYEGMIIAVKEMALSGIQSDGRDFRFYVGNEESNLMYGRTNLAAFLAMAMAESIAYDTCDEFNLDQVAGKYAISNSCGQNGRSYQHEVCTNPSDEKMSCKVDNNMVMVSSSATISQVGRPPPPLSCRPKTDWTDYAGYWDSKTGQASTTPYANTLGRIDTEGCCWWGRGVLLTRGVCNIGRLNYYLGKRAHDERGDGRFPSIDFCKNPEATCASDKSTEEMRWITGLFDWIYRVQYYEADDWSYIEALRRFVDNGFIDDEDEPYPFIDTISSVFERDCHGIKCSNLQITKKDERIRNFYTVLEIMKTTDKPSKKPTPNPTAYMEPTATPSKPNIEIKPPPPAWSQPPPGSSVILNPPPAPTEISLTPPALSPTTANNPTDVNLNPPAPPSPLVSITPPTTDDSKGQTPQQTETPFEGLIILDDNLAFSITGVVWPLLIVIAYLI